MANAKLLRRLTALILLFLALGSAALAEEDSDGIVYVEPTYPENAAQWDPDHPEILEPDMLRAHARMAGAAMDVHSPIRPVPRKAWKGYAALNGTLLNETYGLPSPIEANA